MCNFKELWFDIAEHCDTGISVLLEPAVHEFPEMMKWFLVGLEEGEAVMWSVEN